MDCNGIGRHDFVQFLKNIDDITFIKTDNQLPVFGIYDNDGTDIAVENIFIIIIPDLHDFIIQFKNLVAPNNLQNAGIEGFLQLFVQVLRSRAAFCHGTKHLYFFRRKTEFTGYSVFHQINDKVCALFAALLLEHKEISPQTGTQIRQFPLVDQVSIANNIAFSRLSEHFDQFDNRHDSGSDNVAQHISGTDRRQLVDISDQNKRRSHRGGFN